MRFHDEPKKAISIIQTGIISYITQSSWQYARFNEKEKERLVSLANRFSVFSDLVMDAHNSKSNDFNIENMLPFVIFAMDNGVDVMSKMKAIKEYVNNASTEEARQELVSTLTSYHRGNSEAKIALLSLDKKFDWSGLVASVLDKIKNMSYYYINQEFSTVVMNFAKSNKNGFLKVLQSSMQSSGGHKHDIRSEFAYAASYMGFLDKRQARRYRSECSSVSLRAAKGLVEGKVNYEPLHFAKCISQFSDSKHYDVVHYLQTNLPIENLNILFANDLACNRTISNRIDQYNKEKELSEKGEV